eukprot:COSAG01_NODE_638_length_14605_cov_46.266097_16_plen_123_part_00
MASMPSLATYTLATPLAAAILRMTDIATELKYRPSPPITSVWPATSCPGCQSATKHRLAVWSRRHALTCDIPACVERGLHEVGEVVSSLEHAGLFPAPSQHAAGGASDRAQAQGGRRWRLVP